MSLPLGGIPENFSQNFHKDPIGVFKTKDNRQLNVRQIDSKDLKSINSTLKAWKEIAMERLGHTRASENRQDFIEDKEVVDGYKELISRFGEMLKNPNYQFKIVLDEDNNIQAICCYTVKEKEIYVSQVFSAPWNLRMHGSIDEEHKKLATKGSGSVLIAACYLEGQKQGKEQLRLKPLSGSFSYYKEQLKMEEDKEKDEFYFRITPELPAKISDIFRKSSP